MKKFLLIILLSGFVGFSQNKGKLEFNNNVIDFGELMEGSTAKESISFQNVGDQPVQIEKISSTGHVNVERYPKNAVQPNSKNEIVVSYNTDKIGPIRRTLTIYSNAENSFISIKIKGNVNKKD